MRWRMRQNGAAGPAASLVEETELFLGGGYLEVALAESVDIPAWTWLSTLAHGDDGTLREAEQFGASHGGIRPEYDTWGRVLQQLARQVRAILDTGRCSLEEIQHDLLMPLELTIMGSAIGPATLYRVVSSMLDHVRISVGLDPS